MQSYWRKIQKKNSNVYRQQHGREVKTVTDNNIYCDVRKKKKIQKLNSELSDRRLKNQKLHSEFSDIY